MNSLKFWRKKRTDSERSTGSPDQGPESKPKPAVWVSPAMDPGFRSPHPGLQPRPKPAGWVDPVPVPGSPSPDSDPSPEHQPGPEAGRKEDPAPVSPSSSPDSEPQAKAEAGAKTEGEAEPKSELEPKVNETDNAPLASSSQVSSPVNPAEPGTKPVPETEDKLWDLVDAMMEEVSALSSKRKEAKSKADALDLENDELTVEKAELTTEITKLQKLQEAGQGAHLIGTYLWDADREYYHRVHNEAETVKDGADRAWKLLTEAVKTKGDRYKEISSRLYQLREELPSAQYELEAIVAQRTKANKEIDVLISGFFQRHPELGPTAPRG